MSSSSTTEAPTLTPREAITAVLARFPFGVTTKSVSGTLRASDYRWPVRPGRYPYPSVDRVGSTLRAMLAAGQVTRTEGPDGFMWRLADATERGVAALVLPGTRASA